MIIKPLDRAMADGDDIYAVIRATGSNQDGQTSTITVPSAEAQARILKEALDNAGISPDEVGYFEAHGTGTAVGDPIEASAIGAVFAKGRAEDNPLYVGSIKSVVGHQEPAAGIVGLIKAALCVNQGAIPPNLNFKTPSPYIPFDDLRIKVPTEVTDWPEWTDRRVAAVNSFGFGGTNACAIVEQPPETNRFATGEDQPERRWVVPLSAASETALKTSAKRLADHLKKAGDAAPVMRDLVATLGQRRAHLPQRLALVASSVSQLSDRLSNFAKGKEYKNLDKDAAPFEITSRRFSDPKVAFVFAGQGGQWWGMAQHLLRTDPVFRAEVEAFDAHFAKHSGFSVIDELMRDEASSQVDDLFYAQPSLFALQAGLVARWRAWGLEPDAVIGHSFGEVCTGYCSGALSLEDAARVVYYRAKSTEMVRGRGGIATLALSADEAQQTLQELGETEVGIAGINSSSMINLAGHTDALQRVLDHLVAKDPDLFFRVLKVNFPPHCFVQDEVKDYMMGELAALTPNTPAVPMYSTVTGRPIDDTPLDNEYWFRNQRQTVLFKQALDNALADGINIFVEIGPHATLSGLVSGNAMEAGKTVVAVPSLHRKQEDADSLAAALGTVHCAGAEVDWASATASDYNAVKLPTYPWELKRYWLDSPEAQELLFEPPVHPLLGKRMAAAAPTWECDIDIHTFPYLRDHAVGGSAIFPGTGYLEIMLAVAKEIFGDGPVELEDVQYVEALPLPDGHSETVQASYDSERRIVRIHSRDAQELGDWTLRAQATITQMAPKAVHRVNAPNRDPAEVLATKGKVYKRFTQFDFAYGPAFQGVRKMWQDGEDFAGYLTAPTQIRKEMADYRFHPAFFDSMLHLGIGDTFRPDVEARLKALGPDAMGTGQMPTGIEKVQYLRAPGPKVVARTRTHQAGPDGNSFSTDIFDAESGELVARVDRMVTRPVGKGKAKQAEGAQLGYYAEVWEEEPLDAEAAPFALSPSQVILDDGAAFGKALAREFQALGHTVWTVSPGEAFARNSNEITLRPGEFADYQALLAAVVPEGAEDRSVGIVHLWSMRPSDHATPPTADDLMTAQTLGANSLMQLSRAIADRPDLAVDISTVTFGAAIVPETDSDPDPYRLAHAALNGFARTAGTELENLRIRSIDLDTERSARSRSSAIAQILVDDSEETIALRGGRRFVRRVQARPAAEIAAARVPVDGPDGAQPFRVTMSAPGVLENLSIVEADIDKPGPGQVSLRVHAVGLNFRDVMAATGLLPAGAEAGNSWEALGLECAGEITAVGRGVKNVKPGDRVMASARGCLRSDVLAEASQVNRIPRGVDYEGAATIGSVFMTAYYSLVVLGRLKKGERVLIHTATGGVGLAAVQIAKMIGAEIFATAGSPKKRAYLKKLGIRHIMDSRSLAFAEQIMDITNGEGVDVVLNALAGPAIEKGISVLRPFGRFLEIGKRDVYENSPIGLKALRKNIAFHVIDLANVTANRAEEMAETFEELLGLFSAGKLKPLPAEVFPVSEIADAFRHMSRARHIGKVVVNLDEPDLMVERDGTGEIGFRKDASYLITGGTKGFGLSIATWMAGHGAGTLYLVSRSGAAGKASETAIREMEANGTKVVVVKADVSRTADVDRLLKRIARTSRPLRGVIHGAMVLDDAFINQLDASRMERVMAPKVMGAWNLHTATQDLPLDFFMSMSSLASVFGSRGQGNYVAANSYLDVFAQYRQSLGLAGQTVNWGALGGVGAVARSKQLQRYMESMGMPVVPLEASLGAIGFLMRKEISNAVYFKVDWPLLLRTNPDIGKSRRFAPIVETIAQGEGGGKVRSEIMAATGAARTAMLAKYLAGQVAGVLRTDADKIDPERPLSELGLDSLTSFELKNRIEGDLAIDLPVAKFLQKPTITGLTEAVASRLEAGGDADEVAAGGDVQEIPLTDQLNHFWNIWKNDPMAAGTMGYLNVGFAIGIRPGLDRQRLQQAFQKLVTSQPVLRARFPEIDGAVRGHIDAAHPTGVVFEDATGLSDREFMALLVKRRTETIDLENGPLFQIQVFRRPDESDVVLFRISHLICDGWTNQLIASALFRHYFGVGAGSDPAEGESAAQFSDFARWEKDFLASDEGRKLLKDEARRFADAGPPIRLPAQSSRHQGAPRAGGSIPFELDKRTTAAVRDLARTLGSSSFSVLLAGFAAHLHATTGESDIPIWSAAANRGRRQFHQTLGWLANLVMVREPILASDNFRVLVGKVSEGLTEAVVREEVHYISALQEAAASGNQAAADVVTRGNCTSRLHQVSFSMLRAENTDDIELGALLHEPDKRLEFGGLDLWSVPVPHDVTVTDFGARVQQHDGKWFGEMTFDTENYAHDPMVDFTRDYVAAIKKLVAEPSRPVGEVLREAERVMAVGAE